MKPRAKKVTPPKMTLRHGYLQRGNMARSVKSIGLSGFEQLTEMTQSLRIAAATMPYMSRAFADAYGLVGVGGLVQYSPVDTGLLAHSWGFIRTDTKGSGSEIEFTNNATDSQGDFYAGFVNAGIPNSRNLNFVQKALARTFNQGTSDYVFDMMIVMPVKELIEQFHHKQFVGRVKAMHERIRRNTEALQSGVTVSRTRSRGNVRVNRSTATPGQIRRASQGVRSTSDRGSINSEIAAMQAQLANILSQR